MGMPSEIEHAHDVGMRELLGQFRLAPEARHCRLGHDETGVEYLDGYRAPEVDLSGAEHRSKAASADGRVDAIAPADDRSRIQTHRTLQSIHRTAAVDVPAAALCSRG
jgi:hypothetical protein